MDPLDQLNKAVCECRGEERFVTFRQLKNRWPVCRCNQTMKVLPDAITTVHSTNRMGHAGNLSSVRRRKRDSY